MEGLLRADMKVFPLFPTICSYHHHFSWSLQLSSQAVLQDDCGIMKS